MLKNFIYSTMSSLKRCKIGVIQITCSDDKLKNFENIKRYMTEAVSKDVKFIFLPENTDFISSTCTQVRDLAEDINGEYLQKFKNFAADNKVWISIGSLHLKREENVYNSHVVLDNSGEIKCVYDKVHLFDSNVSVSCKSYPTQESLYITKGSKAPSVIPNTPCGNLATSICYDVRFSELASANRHIGKADVLTYPSAFAQKTGSAHWEILLRARAIENQTYVVAAAQVGYHNENRSSYGHSMVVDPWGQVIAKANGTDPELLICELFGSETDPSGHVNSIHEVRTQMPVESHRRYDLDYCLADAGSRIIIPDQDHTFGPNIIQSSCIFYRSKSSFAFVNLSPLVPGHVLVSPVKEVDRFDKLALGELTDLYATVKMITKGITQHFGATSLTVSIQDGKDAGQSVPHVHVHVLPRKVGDFEKNDDIYSKLQEHDKIETRVKRSLAEMAEEAGILRKIFYSSP